MSYKSFHITTDNHGAAQSSNYKDIVPSLGYQYQLLPGPKGSPPQCDPLLMQDRLLSGPTGYGRNIGDRELIQIYSDWQDMQWENKPCLSQDVHHYNASIYVYMYGYTIVMVKLFTAGCQYNT